MSLIRQMLDNLLKVRAKNFIKKINKDIKLMSADIVFAAIYFLILTPVAIVKRSFSQSLLARFDDKSVNSRWHIQEQSTQQKEIYRSKL